MRKCDERQALASNRSVQGRGYGMREGLVIRAKEEEDDLDDDDDFDEDDDFDDDDEDDDDLDDDEEEADDE